MKTQSLKVLQEKKITFGSQARDSSPVSIGSGTIAKLRLRPQSKPQLLMTLVQIIGSLSNDRVTSTARGMSCRFFWIGDREWNEPSASWYIQWLHQQSKRQALRVAKCGSLGVGGSPSYPSPLGETVPGSWAILSQRQVYTAAVQCQGGK